MTMNWRSLITKKPSGPEYLTSTAAVLLAAAEVISPPVAASVVALNRLAALLDSPHVPHAFGEHEPEMRGQAA